MSIKQEKRCPNGHARFNFMTVNGVRHCQCRDCSTQWMVVLSGRDGDTDYLPNDMPGICKRR